MSLTPHFKKSNKFFGTYHSIGKRWEAQEVAEEKERARTRRDQKKGKRKESRLHDNLNLYSVRNTRTNV